MFKKAAAQFQEHPATARYVLFSDHDWPCGFVLWFYDSFWTQIIDGEEYTVWSKINIFEIFKYHR